MARYVYRAFPRKEFVLLLFSVSFRASAARAACALSLLSLAAVPASAHHSHAGRSTSSPAVQAQNKALSSGSVVQAAYAFRGTRYVMGGTSRSGFDCSGFVRIILGATDGVALPRTAMEQYEHGTPVSQAEAQPGDLVFFKNTYKAGISHVGIYVGGGQFVHAANAHKGVRADSLNSSYYQAHFAGIRRVLPVRMRAAGLR